MYARSRGLNWGFLSFILFRISGLSVAGDVVRKISDGASTVVGGWGSFRKSTNDFIRRRAVLSEHLLWIQAKS